MMKGVMALVVRCLAFLVVVGVLSQMLAKTAHLLALLIALVLFTRRWP